MKSVLPRVTFCGACTWHILSIDFPNNLKHVPGYKALKNFVKSKLVNNTTDKDLWHDYLNEACRSWPLAAEYLQSIAVHKHRWGHPWRIENLTLGFQASSPVESSFSAFKRSTDNVPVSFAAVVQRIFRT